MEDRRKICLKRLVLARIFRLIIGIFMVLFIYWLIRSVFQIIVMESFGWPDTPVEVETWRDLQITSFCKLLKHLLWIALCGFAVWYNIKILADEVIIRFLPLSPDKIVRKMPEIDTLDDAVDVDLMSFDVDLHGKYFSEFCAAVRYENLEFVAAFDEDGRKLAECTSYDAIGIELSENLLAQCQGNSVISVHCHPGADCAAFSDRDFGYAIDRSRYIAVVTRSYTYILEDRNHGAPQRLLNGRIFRRLVRKYYDRLAEGQFLDIIGRVCPEIYRWCTVLTCRRLAKRYNFCFTVRPAWKDDWQFFYRQIKRGRAAARRKMSKTTP